ncbi:uncharacterized protein LOC100900751 [Galendromus occidentalis]|uniref:Uncharacterized protein LOC100900751 n=1 Tax=Galendromus occidentalis TaxID=34638 RepID=A0AAJ6W088_9ACAR|nr:uncharacterized protein LOC100900751 [Galendromus occidentalis]
MISPMRTRILRARALPSAPNRLAIEPPPVVTIDDEEVGSRNQESEMGADCNIDDPGIADSNFYKLTILKHPDEIDRGEFRLRAQQVRVGTFLLKDRLVTFSRSNLQILARPVDSLTQEVELNFTYKDILKTMWALSAETPAMLFNFSPDCGERIRGALHMKTHEAVKNRWCNDAKHPYFEPKAPFERQRQVVILLGESLSEEEYRLIQDCYMSPKGHMKKEFAEKILELTAPNINTPETPLPVEESVPSILQPQELMRPGTSSTMRPGIRKRKTGDDPPSHFVTGNGIVTVMAVPTARALPKLQPGVVFTDDSPICQYPPSGKGSIVIRAPDLLTLMPDKSVNDAVIDFYLSYIIGELLPKERADKVFAFNTFFYSSLVKDPPKTVATGIPAARRHHANVKRWTKGVDLFAKDFILIPVCEHSHWFLIIVCYPWLVPKKLGIKMDCMNKDGAEPNLVDTPAKDSPDSSTGGPDPLRVNQAQKDSTPAVPSPMQRRSDLKAGIFVFDSLRGNVTPSSVYPLIRNYLTEEFLVKKEVECSFDYYTMRGYYPIAPQQTNFHDCGIFLLEYAKKFLLNPPAPEDMGLGSRFNKMFDPDHIMEEGRWHLAEVMFLLNEKQFPELKGMPRAKYEKQIRVKGKTVGEETSLVPIKRTRAGNAPK